ncbi:MAG: cbb3-type cytochrome c oxidase subunit I [Candidatus Thalassarchaeaceae archaeon]|jgi:heme/copper-type cytochrome/quinol oxidase subunit 1|nr:cbb3-type cytochrome c oxidase subunit I [Candidatus Thalassarchaeaceae archaeon]MDP7043756.1 cbb3-type cytochrome c oxidase subunit I [Candidatus Thalassarchaeaceae archaeon]
MRGRTSVLILALLIAVMMAPTSIAKKDGISGDIVNNGCVCHGANSDPDVTVTLTGLPDKFEAGTTYNLTVTISGGPDDTGENIGGFSLNSNLGTFNFTDDFAQIMSDGEITHTEAGNDFRTWEIQWTAPNSDQKDVTFMLYGNSVDGDNLTLGDSWNSVEYTVQGINSNGGPIVDFGNIAWWIIIFAILAVAGGVILALVMKSDFGKPELMHWLTTTNHKDIGLLYLWATILFSVIGLALSVLIRLQLMVPDNQFLTGGLFNEVVTMHGAVMVLFAISPMSFAFANYIVPLQIGARDMAFPRLNAFSFWAMLLGGLVAASGFFFGGAADAGWTFYSPLTSIEYSPGAGISLAGAGLVLLILSVSGSTINFLVTILQMRVPSMKLMQMPMFSWNILFTVILMLIVFPALLGAVLMLVGDRVFGTLFFDPSIDGSTWWLHIFWFFGHPEVYIVLLPGLGMAMEVVPTFVRRTLYGRKIIIWALVVASIISVIVWAHHMFLTGINPTFRKLETIGTELVSVPFGLIYLSLLATFYRSKPQFNKLPLAFVMSAIGIFLVGGITGVYLSSVAMDVQLRGTYYIVAHFHYTLGSVAVMTLGGIYYWYPKMFGRMLNTTLGWWHFWLTFIGINLTFIPLFGMWDMPRRIYSYGEETGWATEHLFSTIGSLVVFIGQAIFFWNFIRSMKNGDEAGEDPWGGSTFEWMTSSPPPSHNFDELPELSLEVGLND